MKFAHLLPAMLIFALLACGSIEPGAPARTSAAGSALPSRAVSPSAVDISTGVDQQFRIPVGPPKATLAVWVLEPKAGMPVRGTVLFLHGFLATHTQVQNAARALRNAGYRSVLIDLRGWGESTSDEEHATTAPQGAITHSITFGVRDARDLSQLTDVLQSKKLCGPALGVYGTSYGAATAIIFAGQDPRVTTVIAVAPFATIRDEVPSFSRNALGGAASLFSDSSLNALANAVSSVASLDLDTARPLDAITKTRAHILLIHGDIDSIVPHTASEQLHAAAPDHSELLTIPGRDHLELCFDIPGQLQAPTRGWFDRYLGAKPE